MESLLMSIVDEERDEEGEGYRDEESDDDFDEDQHKRLLQSMSSLSSKRDKKNSQRTVAHTTASEFGFDKRDEESRLNLNELVANINSSHVSNLIKKNMRRLSSVQKAKIPLTKPQQERITRKVAYKLKKEEISKWQPVVNQNRKAEQLTFPLNRPDLTMRTSDQLTKGFKARTPLELEIAKLLHGSSYVENTTKMLTPAEEKALKVMDLEEAKERRAELMKYRALMTYNEAKFRRRKKIKSKRYHKVLRKEKLKREEKELDELEKTDPEAYLEKLEYVNKARIEERMSLKHRGGSKFARKKMMYARYDPMARQAVQDMIDKNKELTKKQYQSSDDDEEEGGVSIHEGGGVSIHEEEELQMLSSTLDTKGSNPWMKAPAKVSDFSRPKQVMERKIDDDDEEEEEEEEELVVNPKSDDVDILQLEANRLRKLKERQREMVYDLSGMNDGEEEGETEKLERKLSLAMEEEEDDEEEELNKKANVDDEEDGDGDDQEELSKKENRKGKKTGNGKKKKLEKEMESEDDEDDDEDEDKDVDTLFDILEKMEEQISRRKQAKISKEKLAKAKVEKVKSDKKKKIKVRENDEDDDDDDESGINQSMTRKRTLEEFEGNLEEEEKIPTKVKKEEKKDEERDEEKDAIQSIDPNKLFTVEGDVINTRLDGEDDVSDDEEEEEDDDRMTIAQAFADDDVIEEFNLEKEDNTEKEKNKDINLVLPGWGDWGGEGIEVSQKKKKKFILKGKNKERKDSRLGNVILNEKKDEALAEHQVKQLPRKFLNPTQFEQSISQPVGNTWNTEKAFQRMIKPVVVTKLGTVIKPMDKEEVFKKQQVHKKTRKSFDKHLPANKSKNSSSQSKFTNIVGLKKVIAGKRK